MAQEFNVTKEHLRELRKVLRGANGDSLSEADTIERLKGVITKLDDENAKKILTEAVSEGIARKKDEDNYVLVAKKFPATGVALGLAILSFAVAVTAFFFPRSDVQELQNAVQENVGLIDQIDTAVNENADGIVKNASAVASATAAIATNEAAIASVRNQASTNTTAIAEASTRIAANEAAIADITAAVQDLRLKIKGLDNVPRSVAADMALGNRILLQDQTGLEAVHLGNFPKNSTKLTRRMNDRLDKLLTQKGRDEIAFEAVYAIADSSTGTADYNQRISENRAESIWQYIGSPDDVNRSGLGGVDYFDLTSNEERAAVIIVRRK